MIVNSTCHPERKINESWCLCRYFNRPGKWYGRWGMNMRRSRHACQTAEGHINIESVGRSVNKDGGETSSKRGNWRGLAWTI